MITGVVSATLDAVVRLWIQGPTGRRQQVQAVVDTGFNGFLSLQPGTISRLELPFWHEIESHLADGSASRVDVFIGTVLWDGRSQDIGIDCADTMPLIGMKLLEGFNLNVDVVPNGKVQIRRLRRRRA